MGAQFGGSLAMHWPQWNISSPKELEQAKTSFPEIEGTLLNFSPLSAWKVGGRSFLDRMGCCHCVKRNLQKSLAVYKGAKREKASKTADRRFIFHIQLLANNIINT